MDNKLIKRYVASIITKAKKLDNGVLEGVIATDQLDRQGEVLDISGLDIKTYMRAGGPVLFGHDYTSLPIGKALSIRKTTIEGVKQLVGQFQLAVDVSPIAKQVYDLIVGGFLQGLSIGFIGKQWDSENNTWTESEMIEFSVVPVPANASAMVTAKAQGNKIDAVERFIGDNNLGLKGALPFKDTPLADKDMSWDGPMQVSMCEGMDDLKAIHTWVDSEGDPEVKSSYKLPHHMAEGNHATVWNGVRAAMGALMGARGGVRIPEEDRKAVYNHLAKHYKQFDEEPPEFKSLEEVENEEINDFETLSANISALKEQITALAQSFKGVDTVKKAVGQKKRRLVLVKAKKNAQIIDKQVELVIAGFKKQLET